MRISYTPTNETQPLDLDMTYPDLGDAIQVGLTIKKLYASAEGTYFLWNGQRQYLHFLREMTLEKLKSKLAAESFFTEAELILAILNTGIDRVQFLVPTSKLGGSVMSGEQEQVLCSLSEERYPLDEQYKMTLIPVDGDVRFKRDVYVTDLASWIRKGFVHLI